jgi:hypothetical protein
MSVPCVVNFAPLRNPPRFSRSFNPAKRDEYEIIGMRYCATALPCNFVVDKDGILKAKYFGYSEDVKRHFEGQLRGLLLNP